MTKNPPFAEKCQETVLEWLLLSAVKTFTDNFDNCSLGRYEIISWDLAFYPPTPNTEDRILCKLLISHFYNYTEKMGSSTNCFCFGHNLYWLSLLASLEKFKKNTHKVHCKQLKNTFKEFTILFDATFDFINILNIWRKKIEKKFRSNEYESSPQKQ